MFIFSRRFFELVQIDVLIRGKLGHGVPAGPGFDVSATPGSMDQSDGHIEFLIQRTAKIVGDC